MEDQNKSAESHIMLSVETGPCPNSSDDEIDLTLEFIKLHPGMTLGESMKKIMSLEQALDNLSVQMAAKIEECNELRQSLDTVSRLVQGAVRILK